MSNVIGLYFKCIKILNFERQGAIFKIKTNDRGSKDNDRWYLEHMFFDFQNLNRVKSG